MACKERGRLELSRFLILIQSRDHDPGSGTTTEGREALRTVLDFLHPGDVLTVTRIDRLARSIGDLQDIVRTVRARGASLKVNRAADRHLRRGRQVLPRHARCVRLGIGDEVVIPGLFHSHLGTQRNVPIVRTGNIAAMRDEPVPTSYGSMDAYLVEMRSIGGISGSPVLMHMEMRPAVLLPESDVAIAVEKSKKVHYLFGLVHGHYTITTQDEWVYKTNSLVGDINAGTAVVVPASKIMETIRQPTVFGEEQEVARKYREAMGAPK
jgi:hypothetical protein